jgi:hypothetical protein
MTYMSHVSGERVNDSVVRLRSKIHVLCGNVEDEEGEDVEDEEGVPLLSFEVAAVVLRIRARAKMIVKDVEDEEGILSSSLRTRRTSIRAKTRSLRLCVSLYLRLCVSLYLSLV